MQKNRPSNPFSKLEENQSTQGSQGDLESASGFSIGGSLQKAKTFVLGREEPEPQGWLRIFNCLPNEKSYMYAAIAFGVAAFFLLLCFFLLATFILAPAKFCACFSLAMVSLICGLAFLHGPRLYIKKLFISKNLVASCVLIVSTLCALWFSLIE